MSQPELAVRGGAGGIAARYADLEWLAGCSEADAAALAVVAIRDEALLLDRDVTLGALRDPAGMARFVAALVVAVEGLSALAAQLLGRATALRVAARSYQATDRAARELLDGVRFMAGASAVGALPAAAGVAWASSALGLDGERLLTGHPGLVDTAVGAAPGMLGWPPGVTSAAQLLGRLYPDGTSAVADLGVDPAMVRPPSGYGDLMAGLIRRDGMSVGADQAQIDVRVLSRPDGSRAYIVDLPGMRDAHLMPGWHPGPLNDLGTDLRALGGEPTSYQAGVAEALHRAGATSTDPVMLVGHSQGGLIALDAARDFVAGGQFRVTHVLTFGAPIGRLDVPGAVQVLAVENRHDVVVHLDAAANRDTPGITTVSFSHDTGDIGLNHGLATTYAAAAGALDASVDPSVAAFRASAAAFLDPSAQLTTHAYRLSRVHP